MDIDWKVDDRCVRQHSPGFWFTGTVKEVHEKTLGILWDYEEHNQITQWDRDKIERPKN